MATKGYIWSKFIKTERLLLAIEQGELRLSGNNGNVLELDTDNACTMY